MTVVLVHFDPKADHIMQVDRSMKALGAVLLQKYRPDIYASNILTPAETGYSNTERELLSVVFGLKRLHHYVFCSKIKVQTHHKPLIPIWKKSITAVMHTTKAHKIWCTAGIPERQRQCHSQGSNPSQPT